MKFRRYKLETDEERRLRCPVVHLPVTSVFLHGLRGPNETKNDIIHTLCSQESYENVWKSVDEKTDSRLIEKKIRQWHLVVGKFVKSLSFVSFILHPSKIKHIRKIFVSIFLSVEQFLLGSVFIFSKSSTSTTQESKKKEDQMLNHNDTLTLRFTVSLELRYFSYI